MTDEMKYKNADLLNRLDEMQRSPYYKVAHGVLRHAELTIARQEENIAELTSKLAASDAEVTRLAVAVQPSATIDSDEFQDLLSGYVYAYPDGDSDLMDRKTALIAHIDARLAAAGMVDKPQWISISERLPEVGVSVIVYSPPTQHDWPNSLNIEFDCIDPDGDGTTWLGHNENYEHFCCVAKPEGSIGPSEKAPYTHWMPLPPVPAMSAAEGESK